MGENSDKPKLGKKHRLLLRVERFSRKNYRLVFLLASLALVAGIWLGSKLELEPNVLALIPEGNRQVDTLKEALDDFGSIDYLLVLLQAEEEHGAEELEEFADLFAERLYELEDLIDFVEYRFELDSEFLELFYRNALLFLPPDRLPELAAKLSDDAIMNSIEANRLALSTPAGDLAQELIVNDPLGLMPLFLNRLEGNRGLLKFDLTDGYYVSEDGRTLIMLVKPIGPSQDLEFDQRLLDAVQAAEATTRSELLQQFDDGEKQSLGVKVRYSGNYAVAMDEARMIRQDVKFNLFVSLFAVSALYWLCYRRFAALLYSSIPLLIGQALTFALAYFVLGGLNASSAAFTALLMGLGTDFVIVIYARYVEERQKGRTLAQATEKMIGETGLGVFTGAITSAGTFYAMCISQFQGLKDLGFLIGGGILLCAVAILFLLPAMIKWNEGVRKRKVDAVKKLHLQSFFIEHLITFSARHRVLVISVVAVLTLLSAWGATRLEFDDTISVLRSKRSDAYRVQQEISKKFGASISYMMAIAEAETQEDAVQMAEGILERLEAFKAQGVVASYDSILTYLPPEVEQQRVLQALRHDEEGEFDLERIRASFLTGLRKSGFVEESFAGFLERMELFLTPDKPVGLGHLEDQGLERLLGRYIRKDENRVRIVTYIFLSDPRWKREAPPGLVEVLTEYDDRIVVTGINVVGGEFRRIFTREAPRAVLLGLVVVLILLWIDFRSLRLTMIALAQLICGVVIMLGMMKVTGVHLNYVNAFVATMILGVGIDYSIHLVHRLSLSDGKIEAGLLETGKAVVMAALTNIAGFGTLTLGNYPALRSFGQVALYGSIACLFTALTLVPAIMAKKEK
jgi:predicted RND superfamily exporter protein